MGAGLSPADAGAAQIVACGGLKLLMQSFRTNMDSPSVVLGACQALHALAQKGRVAVVCVSSELHRPWSVSHATPLLHSWYHMYCLVRLSA